MTYNNLLVEREPRKTKINLKKNHNKAFKNFCLDQNRNIKKIKNQRK